MSCLASTPWASIGLLMLVATVAPADVIERRNARPIKGEVLYQDEDYVAVRTYTGTTLRLPAGEVVAIRPEDDDAMRRERVERLTVAGRFEEALALLGRHRTGDDARREVDAQRAAICRAWLAQMRPELKKLEEDRAYAQWIAMLAGLRREARGSAAEAEVAHELADAYIAWAEHELDFIRDDAATEVLGQAVRAGLRDARLHLMIARRHREDRRLSMAFREYQIAQALDPALAGVTEEIAALPEHIRNPPPEAPDPVREDQALASVGRAIESAVARRVVSVTEPRTSESADPGGALNLPDSPFTRTLTRTEHDKLARHMTEDRRRFDAIIDEASARYNVEPAWIKAMIMAESSFRPGLTSHAGAKGLMQLMDGTAADMGVRDPFDPRQNIMGGTRYIRMMLNMFNQDRVLALAAYNAGPGTVKIYGGVPDYKETRQYIERVILYYQFFAYQDGAG